MTKPDHASELVALLRRKRLVRARDVEAAGIPRAYLTRLVRKGEIRRLARGLYELADAPSDENASLAEVCKRLPRATICLLSAAQFHDLTTAAPPAVWIMLPSHTPHPRVDFVRLEIVYTDPSLLGPTAVEQHDHFGSSIRITTAARTVADMFRFRNRVGLELALEVLRSYANRTQDFSDLLGQAKRLRVDGVLTPYVQALST